MAHDFKIDRENTQDHWLELTGHIPGSPVDVWLRVVVKWDGCIHFHRFYNAPEGVNKPDEQDYLHICDIDEMIADLQRIKELAQAHFHDREAWRK